MHTVAKNEILLREAKAFLEQAYRESGRAGELPSRWRDVRKEIRRSGSYRHTTEELIWGARLAWRNSNRCIGRLFWNTLEVHDARGVDSPEAMADTLRQHLRDASNGGNLKNRITVFEPDGVADGQPVPAPLRMANKQMLGYAAFRVKGPGTPTRIIGDPLNLAFTDRVRALGWNGPVTPWTLLPWLIEAPDGREWLFAVPEEDVLEVPMAHDAHPRIAELGLRWYGLPAIADMELRIGGVRYPAAPFNGWYMVTEIAARDLADADRFNALPAVGEAIGRPPSKQDPYWRDQALVVLNETVLQSFRREGVRIVDHHLASQQFQRFVAQERAQGRPVTGDWSWLIPPMSPAACPQFHTPMDNRALDPIFHYRPGTETPPAQALPLERGHQGGVKVRPDLMGGTAGDGAAAKAPAGGSAANAAALGCPFHQAPDERA